MDDPGVERHPARQAARIAAVQLNRERVDAVASDQGARCADVKARRIIVRKIEACVRVRAAERISAKAPVVVGGDGGAELGRSRGGKAEEEKAD
jgi:hypothetical protein